MKNKKLIDTIINIIILIVFILITVRVGQYHEAWADEAQAWLIARDMSINDILFQIGRYEGTPTLWHLILKLLICLGYKYEYMYLISIFFTSIGIGIILFKLDLPKIIKVLLPFTYFIIYEYTIKARSYCLILPVIALIAVVYKDRKNKIILYNFLLGLFATISLHTAVISGVLYLTELFDLAKNLMKEKNIKKHKKSIISHICLGLFYILIIVCIFPAEDVMVSILATSLIKANTVDAITIIVGKFLEAFTWIMSGNTISFIVNLVFIIILFTLILYKNKDYNLFLNIVGFLFLFLVSIRISTHHIGIIFLSFIFALYLVKDSIYENNKKYLKIFLVIIFLVQIFYGINSLQADIQNPYTGAKELADYIKTLDYKNMKIYSSGYYSVAILPYFDENIFYNDRGGTTYYKWSSNNLDLIKSATQDEFKYDINEFEDQPDMIIFNNTSHQKGYLALRRYVEGLEDYKKTYFKGKTIFKGLLESNEEEGFYVYEKVVK